MSIKVRKILATAVAATTILSFAGCSINIDKELAERIAGEVSEAVENGDIEINVEGEEDAEETEETEASETTAADEVEASETVTETTVANGNNGGSTTSSNTPAYAAAYIETINNYVANYSGSQELTYNLIYFDDPSIPALTIAVPGYYVSMYIYRDGRVYQVADEWGYGAFGVSDYQYDYLGGRIYYLDNDYAGALRNEIYMFLGDGYQFVPIYDDLHYQFFEGDMPGETMLDEPLYFVNGEQVSADRYEALRYEGNYRSIIGNYSYSQIMNYLTTGTVPAAH